MNGKLLPLRPNDAERPWDNEPDYWTETRGDYHLIVSRHQRSRGWCGYIGVPRHVFRKLSLRLRERRDPRDADDGTALVHHGWNICIDGQKVIGVDGSGQALGCRSDLIYLGFDCDHSQPSQRDGLSDYTPRHWAEGFTLRTHPDRWYATYRSLPFVIGELERVVAMLDRETVWWRRLLRWAGVRW